ncbi:nuclear transport factor 2 family protein [Streptomyces scopuliridis]|uniref:Nuclear transport factor 2 family protein n=1 Tax=Streptomyces scopuliridis TaxID=452529 RepID=A0ACD4ZX17_9ACTN|nr:nuclear transport factor 2 family protein [Streptomyces scopuliridis]WSC02734.1 nuclear transport factor 2 family protein [Streptomyces scopuliridis]WSC03733.1 nuclear transport factor 2 family protein [Streptomyces scopuliridis]
MVTQYGHQAFPRITSCPILIRRCSKAESLRWAVYAVTVAHDVQRPSIPAGSLEAFPGTRIAPAACRKDNVMDPDIRTKAALEEHWRASERGDTEAEHAIYAADAILDYPQSGERFRGRATISAQRGGHPASRHFTIHRIVGSGDLWVSECVITYDGVPTYSVSIMEFAHGHVVHETQYFADTFGAPEWRTALAEPMPGRNIARA